MPAANLAAMSAPERNRLALVAALLIGLKLGFDGAMLLNDPDTYWHIAVGKGIWTSGSLPRTDTLSHTFAGQPWIAKEWLSQLLLGGAHALAGWRGVVLLSGLAIMSSFGLMAAFLGRYMPPLAVLVITGLAFLVCGDTLLARPHIVVLPVVMLWSIGLVDAADRRLGPPWRLLPLMAIWANMHAGFSFGLVVAAAMAADRIWNAEPGERPRQVLLWAGFGLAGLIASCLSPYGIQSLLVALKLFRGAESMRYIIEWQPLALDLKGLAILGLAALALLALAPEPRRNLPRLLLVLLITAMMVKHVRFTLLFATLVPLVAACPSGPRLGRALAGPDGAARSLPPRRSVMAAVLVLGLFDLAAFALRQPLPDPAKSPAAALGASGGLVTHGRVFNSYLFGGFLIANGVPTFIDGRSDQLFLGGFMNEVETSINASEPSALDELLRRYRVTWALVQPDTAEARQLARLPGWRRSYGDATALVFARD